MTLKNLVTFVLSLLITTTPYTQSLPTFSDQVFRQEIKISVPLPLSMNGEIIRVIPYRGDIVMVCTGGIFRYSKSTWTEVAKGQWQHAFTDAEQQIWLISQDSILAFAKDTGVPLPMEARDHRVISGFYERSTDKFYIGTEKGLYSFDGQWQLHDQIRDFTVNDIKSGFGDDLWVATMDGLWRRNNHNWVNLDNVLMAEANDRQYFSLMNIDSGAYLAYSAPLSVGGIARDGNHWVWSGNSGLPYGPVTLIRARENTFWLGTSMGAIRRDDKSWHYYLGKRWLEEPEVVDILPLEDRTWLATPNSISEIKEININLRDKAEFYDSLIQIRHNRLGLINRSRLTIPGDISTSHAINQDNDGLWTATYLVAQCFRYAATKSEESRELAIRTYEALERLETVTGISGYPARSFARAEDVVEQSRSPHPKKWHRSADGKWQWLDDTSSDEITGHLFSISLFIDYVAEGELKTRAIALIDRIVTNIIDHDFQLIDADGKPTRWGIWNPDSLNHSPNWSYEKGLNSLQILSFLRTAIHFTDKKAFKTAYQYLTESEGYADNAVQAKIYGPYETSHSDDILNFFPYYGLLKYGSDDPLRPKYIQSLARTWTAVQDDHMPVWNIMASAMLNRDCNLETAVRELQLYPLDLIDWTMNNSHRWDLTHDPLIDRGRKAQAVDPIPTPENQIFRWNTNPRRLDAGGNGSSEVSGTYFLVAYWMARYEGYITE